MEAHCRACQTSFQIRAHHPKQSFCSNRCYKRTWARIERGWRPPKKRPCAVCKKIFVPNIFHPRARTCSRRCCKRLEYINNRQQIIEQSKRWAKENRERRNAYSREYRKRTPEKSAARSIVGNALKVGKLLRPRKCSECGKRCKPQAHHASGYDKPLDVVWLCRDCHMSVHHR